MPLRPTGNAGGQKWLARRRIILNKTTKNHQPSVFFEQKPALFGITKALFKFHRSAVVWLSKQLKRNEKINRILPIWAHTMDG
jgi:hypothetical protein